MFDENPITKRLGITYPIIQAGMAGGITTPELVAAVSQAGALGTLGAGYLTPVKMRDTIQKIKQRTDQPFAVNLFVPENPDFSQKKVSQANDWLEGIRQELNMEEPAQSPEINNDNFQGQIEVLIKERVPICSFTFGLPSREIVQRLKNADITLIGTATTVDEALANEERGLDMVVMQGSEAGGHRGTFLGDFEMSMIGTIALVPQAKDYVSIPIIAAGGIMDGRGALAAFILGAEAVQMGTAFVTTKESGAHPLYKQAIRESSEDKTAITKAFSGKPARGIHNMFMKNFDKVEQQLPDYPIQNELTKGIRKEAAKQNRPEYLSLWAGQHPRSSTEKHAKELIQSIVSQINSLVDGLTK
ncbi:NAD(P)H-dependent flavin oxidoreductase [Oceanobacillus alkalisoli]|uniref:NAD(P)H-dependent flavin oxidoreductase n=1 Tax=Oceanobacillus alkalisoli TaxID=2925113 RepID=UPI001EF00724|nr:nitronate monooxygenase [Oceanobacillus alkalisoli]MCF3944344.1 nitronate monooxygenase [Oceanobacillus alkalisoli]MCG5104861.1 nitronate monooxygenase [Oceanobacillus alkalisoli]